MTGKSYRRRYCPRMRHAAAAAIDAEVSGTRFAVILTLTLVVSACAARPGTDTLTPTREASPPEARQVKLLVATDRALEGPTPGTFGSGRGSLRYEEMTVSVPPDHRSGRIEWSKARSGDPSASFVVVQRRQLDEKKFAQEAAVRATHGERNVVFVHGYNYSLQEAVFRAAQLGVDVKGSSPPILFSWPSDAMVAGYVADRDAVTYARDDLVSVLKDLSEAKAKRRTLLLGHSMGGWLVMEAVRQLRLQGREDVISTLEIGLAAPDIDMDVFRKQLEVVGPLNPPLTVLVAADDRALGVSRRLSGDRQRLGAADVNDLELAEFAHRANLRVVDISSVSATDRSNHDRFVHIADAMTGQRTGVQEAFSSLRQTGAFVFNTTGATVGSPFILVGRAVSH